ncbi:MAG: esterase [Succiniclasticum sp.]|jgi:predicted peptidase
MRKYKVFAASLCCTLAFSFPAGISAAADAPHPVLVSAADQSVAEQKGIQEVTALSTVYGEGELVSAVALRYPKPIDAKRLQASDFSVPGKTIEMVYTNDKPETSRKGKTGRYVILTFAHQAPAMDSFQHKPRTDSKEPKKEEKNALNGGDAPMFSDRKAPDLRVSVRQTGTVYATDGTAYGPTASAVASMKTVDAVKDAFQTFVYKDPTTGYEMPYNLYLPEGYNKDAAKTYPMVVFIADASANINDPRAVLYQGNGATIWATPEEQAQHPAIVLAPQYTEDLVRSIGMMTTDTHKWTKGLTLVTHLILDVANRYRVDKSRIYGTGQSQGGMANIAISDAYPELFAAQYLVACQWDVQEMAALKNKNLWIVVCQGDTKAFPAMNEATALWEKEGTAVARSRMWDSQGGKDVFAQMTKVMEDQQAPIRYTVFKDGSHMYTWSFAYNIDGIRQWLFRQTIDTQVMNLQNPAALSKKSGMDEARMKGSVYLDTGMSYLYGKEGVVDYKLAELSFQKAWQAGHKKAGRYLGLIAANGWGRKRNDALAAQWYEKAQQKDDITSMYLLGACYEKGQGVPQDFQKAKSLYEKAARREDHVGAPAMVALGHLYEKGIGVPVDLAKAREWYQKAAATGSADAVEALQSLP